MTVASGATGAEFKKTGIKYQPGCVDDFRDIDKKVNELEFNTGKGFV